MLTSPVNIPQPGPEVAEQLSIYQASLKEKTRQMKAMASELNMYQAQVMGFTVLWQDKGYMQDKSSSGTLYVRSQPRR